MDNTLRKLIDALEKYDSYVIEEIYEQLKFENYHYSNFSELQANVEKLLSKKSDKISDYKQYEMRENCLSRYTKIDCHDFYRFIFPEDSLQICDELDSGSGVGNAIRMDIVNQWVMDKDGEKHHVQRGIQTVITDDLTYLFVCPKNINKSNIIMSNINLNSYFGNRRLRTRIDKIFGLIIEVDGVVRETQMNVLLDNIEDENIPIPNFLVNSGHGLHIYYIFDEPILFHGRSYAIYPVLTNILNAIKDLIWTPLVSDLKPEKMDLNRAFTIVGTRNRKNTDLLVTAYTIKKQKCSLEYLRGFIDEPFDATDYDISFPPRNKVSKEEAVVLYPQWAMKKYPNLFSEECKQQLQQVKEEKEKNIRHESFNISNPKLYEWFLNLLRNPSNIRHGNRYKCMVGLAIYGVKSGVKKEQVQKDLETLLPLFNSVQKRSHDDSFIMTENDIRNALYVYNHKETFLYTFDWIMEFTEIPYEKKTKRRDRPLSQDEHLRIARENLNALYPNGSWRANSDGATRQKILNYIRENNDPDITDCIQRGICSRASAYKYWEECCNELGIENKKHIGNEEKIKRYRQLNPDATKADCIKELKLSKPTVYKYWKD